MTFFLSGKQIVRRQSRRLLADIIVRPTNSNLAFVKVITDDFRLIANNY